MAGRPRKPTALIEATGGYPRDRDGEPRPKGAPRKPSGLNETASRVWDDVIAALSSVKGLLTRADTNILMRYCNSMSRYYQAQAILEKDGVLIKGAKGGVRTRPDPDHHHNDHGVGGAGVRTRPRADPDPHNNHDVCRGRAAGHHHDDARTIRRRTWWHIRAGQHRRQRNRPEQVRAVPARPSRSGRLVVYD